MDYSSGNHFDFVQLAATSASVHAVRMGEGCAAAAVRNDQQEKLTPD